MEILQKLFCFFIHSVVFLPFSQDGRGEPAEVLYPLPHYTVSCGELQSFFVEKAIFFWDQRQHFVKSENMSLKSAHFSAGKY